jgi:hypothetical protein
VPAGRAEHHPRPSTAAAGSDHDQLPFRAVANQVPHRAISFHHTMHQGNGVDVVTVADLMGHVKLVIC